MKIIGNKFYIDEEQHSVRYNNGETEIEIPWGVIHKAIEWQKSRPLEQRSDIETCPKCGEYILKSRMKKHLEAHGGEKIIRADKDR